MVRMVVTRDSQLALRGQGFGFALAASALVGGMVLIGLDKPPYGAAAAIAAVGGLCGMFLWPKSGKANRQPPKRRSRVGSSER